MVGNNDLKKSIDDAYKLTLELKAHCRGEITRDISHATYRQRQRRGENF